jgi:putative spermidine/putrescine transport system substrate-binding protein
MKSIVSIAVISAALIWLPTTGSAQQSLTVASWGGAYTTALTESMYKPFEAKHKIKVLSVDRGGGLGEIAAQVKSGNVKWDVVDADPQEAIKGCEEGLLEKIDSGRLPAGADGKAGSKDFVTGAIQECAVASVVFANVLAYDRARLGNNGPKSVEDLFDTKKFPGKRGLHKDPVGIFEWALMADGVAVGDVYKVLATPAGLDRAFKKLDTIKKDIVWWTAGSQPQNLLASGEVIMSGAWHGRIVDANFKEKKDFVIVWDGQITAQNMFAIPKGSKNAAAAQEFIREATSAQTLADFVNYMPYAPTRQSSIALISDSNRYKAWLPSSTQGGRYLPLSAKFWAENEDEIGKKFNNWLAK